MSDSLPLPELVIGIDFGMTCTGVAFCNVATGEETIRWLQRWPGRANAVENKVPTTLVYPKNSTTPSSWGFLSEMPAEQMSEDKDYKEWFKTFLDDDRLQHARRSAQTPGLYPASMQEVEQLYCDFFRFLYQTIQHMLQAELSRRWEDANVEFIFSVPTAWKPPTVERFRSTFERAGFGRHQNHRADIGLTEAEAAAVHTARAFPTLFREGEVLLVCDVGGGTTDLSVLRVTNVGGIHSLSLEQMDVVQGATIGSVQLDTAFENSARQRLEMANQTKPTGLSPKELDDIAWEMAKSKEYQNAKCGYGSWDDDTEFFTVAIPKLHRDYVNNDAGISYGEMKFRRDEIQNYFEIQVIKLFQLIDKQFARLQQKFPTEQVAHLVLSGGLGNSSYILRRLRERYSSGNSQFPIAQSLQVRVAPEPQLVVCKGIVADRVKKLRSGRSVLGWRCCRASYGTLCKELHNPANPQHSGQRAARDPFDGKLYVNNCISWFVKQGDPVSNDFPVSRPFSCKCPPASQLHPNPPRSFPTAIVTSDMDKDMLPLVMNASCKILCEFTSDFSNIPLTHFKLKNRHWWESGPKYHRIQYVVKVVLGPADILFELWHNGQKLSKDKSIRVDWHAAQAPPEPAATVLAYQSSQPWNTNPMVNTLNEQAWLSPLQPENVPAAPDADRYARTWNGNNGM